MACLVHRLDGFPTAGEGEEEKEEEEEEKGRKEERKEIQCVRRRPQDNNEWQDGKKMNSVTG